MVDLAAGPARVRRRRGSSSPLSATPTDWRPSRSPGFVTGQRTATEQGRTNGPAVMSFLRSGWVFGTGRRTFRQKWKACTAQQKGAPMERRSLAGSTLLRGRHITTSMVGCCPGGSFWGFPRIRLAQFVGQGRRGNMALAAADSLHATEGGRGRVECRPSVVTPRSRSPVAAMVLSQALCRHAEPRVGMKRIRAAGVVAVAARDQW